MKRIPALALLGCLSIVAATSCVREEPGKESPGSGSAGSASQDAPQIPIDVWPKLLAAPISYPEEARLRGEEGTVLVKALVGPEGRVTEASLEPQQTASAVLGKAAVDAVLQWSFEPAQSKGEPVAVWIVVPVKFRFQ